MGTMWPDMSKGCEKIKINFIFWSWNEGKKSKNNLFKVKWHSGKHFLKNEFKNDANFEH